MPTVIDSLLLELGLDNKQFKEGFKEADKVQDNFEAKTKDHHKKSSSEETKLAHEKEKRHKEDEKRHRETIENFKEMREGLLKFFLIFTAGKELKDFIAETITSSLEIGHLSENAQTGIDTVAGLGVVMRELGGSAEDANDAIMKASRAVAHMNSGIEDKSVSGLLLAASRANVEVDLNKARSSTLEFMKAQASVVQGLWKTNKQTALSVAQESMQLNEKQFEAFKEGPEDLMKKIATGAKLSGRNEADVKAAERLQKLWVDITEKLSSVGRGVILPILDSIAGWLSNKENLKSISDGFNELSKIMREVNFKALGEGLALVMKGLAMSIEGISKLLGLLGLGEEKNATDGNAADKKSDATTALQYGVSNTLKSAPQWTLPILKAVVKPELLQNKQNSSTVHVGEVNFGSNPNKSQQEQFHDFRETLRDWVGSNTSQAMNGQN